MTPSPTPETDSLTLGQRLGEARLRQGLDLGDVAEQTCISQKNLQAMEEGNFAALPAEVFTRGYYSLYAKCLGLDQNEVLTLYERERRHFPSHVQLKTPPPYRLAENMKTLAERPSSLPFAYFGFVLLLLLVFGAFLCWYFAWNPASYLSVKLRSLDSGRQVEEKATSPSAPAIDKELSKHEPAATPPKILDLPSPTVATAATAEPRRGEEFWPTSGTTRYHVNAIFSKETKVALTIDQHPTRTMTFRQGEQVSWRAVERLILALPPEGGAKIVLNGIAVELPPPENEKITLNIPASSLR